MAKYKVSMCSSSATPTFHIVDDDGYSASVNDFIVYYSDSSGDYYAGKVCATSAASADYRMEYNVTDDDDGAGVAASCAGAEDYIENYAGYTDNSTGTNTNCTAGSPSVTPTNTPTPTPSMTPPAAGSYKAGKFWYDSNGNDCYKNTEECNDAITCISAGVDGSEPADVLSLYNDGAGNSKNTYIPNSGFAAGIKIFLNPQLTDHLDSEYEYDMGNALATSHNTIAFDWSDMSSSSTFAGFMWQETTSATTKKYVYFFSFDYTNDTQHDSLSESCGSGAEYTDGTVEGPRQIGSATATPHKILFASADGSSSHDLWVSGHSTSGVNGGYSIAQSDMYGHNNGRVVYVHNSNEHIIVYGAADGANYSFTGGAANYWTIRDGSDNDTILSTSSVDTGGYGAVDSFTWSNSVSVGNSATSAVTPTPTPTVTGTSAVTPTPTVTGTSAVTPTPTATGTSAVTPTPTATGTTGVTPTQTPTQTGTSAVTPTPTVTGTSAVTPTPTTTNDIDCSDKLPQWIDSATYSSGTLICDGSDAYVAIQNVPVDKQPVDNSAYWSEVPAHDCRCVVADPSPTPTTTGTAGVTPTTTPTTTGTAGVTPTPTEHWNCWGNANAY